MDRELLASVIAERIEPLIRADGGTISVVDVSDQGEVTLYLGGACSGCPGAEYTLNMVILPILKAWVPGVEKVTPILLVPADSMH